MERIQAIKLKSIQIRYRLRQRMDGGPGSGNWGHEGRPGKIGGSAEGGGTHNRQKNRFGGYTSFSKWRKESAKSHALTSQDIKDAYDFEDIIIVDKGGNRYQRSGHNFECKTTGDRRDFAIGDECRLIIPNKLSPNYKVTRDDKKAMALNQERFERAFYPEERGDADTRYRSEAGEIWNGCSEKEKDSMYRYTSSEYRRINKNVRGGNTDDEECNETIAAITDVIDRSELKQDSVLRRGISLGAAEKLFGLPEGYLEAGNHADEGNISMVGRVGTDDAFMSCGSSQDSGNDRQVVLEILAPEGTKAMYCEPFSAHGLGDRKLWDGKSGQEYFSSECESLLQRGTTLQVISHEMKDSFGFTYHTMRAVILRQDTGSSEYSQKIKKAKRN